MRFLLLSHKYTGFQVHYENTSSIDNEKKLIFEWYGAVDFNEVDFIGLSNAHIYPIQPKPKPYSAVLTANFIKPTLYNPDKVLATLRIHKHSDFTPSTNYKGTSLYCYIDES